MSDKMAVPIAFPVTIALTLGLAPVVVQLLPMLDTLPLLLVKALTVTVLLVKALTVTLLILVI
jgi:hypothetical protein